MKQYSVENNNYDSNMTINIKSMHIMRIFISCLINN